MLIPPIPTSIVPRSVILSLSPLDRNCHQREHAPADREHADEPAGPAVDVPEVPVAGQHVHEVHGDVQGGDHQVSDAQVHCNETEKNVST